MILTEKLKSLVLRSIQGSGKVDKILKHGCKYSDIADWLEQMEAEGLYEKVPYVNSEYESYKISLTKLGRQELGKLLRKLHGQRRKSC